MNLDVQVWENGTWKAGTMCGWTFSGTWTQDARSRVVAVHFEGQGYAATAKITRSRELVRRAVIALVMAGDALA